jgi:hypothetical protein
VALVVACAILALLYGPRLPEGANSFFVFLMVLGGLAGCWLLLTRGAEEPRSRRLPLREPWKRDHRWDPRGATLVLTGPLRNRLLNWHGAVIVVLAAAVATSGITRGAGVAFSGLLGGIALVWSWRVWRVWCHGQPRVSFCKFPYVTGEPVELHFGVSSGGANFLRARFFLRRIEERAQLGSTEPRMHATFRAECGPPRGVMPGAGADVRLVFEVPADAGGTALSARYPSYWELEVVGDTTKGAFAERFLIPIYDPYVPRAADRPVPRSRPPADAARAGAEGLEGR